MSFTHGGDDNETLTGVGGEDSVRPDLVGIGTVVERRVRVAIDSQCGYWGMAPFFSFSLCARLSVGLINVAVAF